MTELNLKCKGRKRYFDCDAGKISFPQEEARPRLEKKTICPRCGIRSMDEVKLRTWTNSLGRSVFLIVMLK
jgi:hypothetical protein